MPFFPKLEADLLNIIEGEVSEELPGLPLGQRLILTSEGSREG